MRTAKDILREHIKRLMATKGQEEYQPMDEIEAGEEYAACVEAMKEYARQSVMETVAVAKEHTDCDLDTEGTIINSFRILGL